MRISKRRAGVIIGAAALCGLVAGGSMVAFAASEPEHSGDGVGRQAAPSDAMPTTKSWPVNDYGLTVGVPNDADRVAQNLPDLTPGETDDGKPGFIRASEIFMPEPKTPAEAAQQTASQLNDKGEWIETVYEADGKTLIGQSLITTVTLDAPVD